jgi:hypothetical protein
VDQQGDPRLLIYQQFHRNGMAGLSLRGSDEQTKQSINQENDDNTFGRLGATGVARPKTKEQTRRTQIKDAGTNFSEFRIVSTMLS